MGRRKRMQAVSTESMSMDTDDTGKLSHRSTTVGTSTTTHTPLISGTEGTMAMPPNNKPSNSSNLTSESTTTPPNSFHTESGELASVPEAATPNPVYAITISLGVVIFVLLFVCLIVLWKITSKRTKSKGDSLKTQNNELKQELGEVNGNFKDPYPVERSVGSSNYYTDSNSKGKEKLKDPYPIEKSVTSLNQYTDPNNMGKKNEGGLAKENNAKDKGTQNNQGYEDVKDRGTQDDHGYETAKVTGPYYHTLDPDAPSDSSYASVRRKQDGGYDALDRQHDPSEAKPKTDSGYDVADRIGKVDAKFEPGNIDNDYSAISRSSANTSGYDNLDHTRRSYEVDNISPNDYNVLQPQGD